MTTCWTEALHVTATEPYAATTRHSVVQALLAPIALRLKQMLRKRQMFLRVVLRILVCGNWEVMSKGLSVEFLDGGVIAKPQYSVSLRRVLASKRGALPRRRDLIRQTVDRVNKIRPKIHS